MKYHVANDREKLDSASTSRIESLIADERNFKIDLFVFFLIRSILKKR